MVDVIGVKNKKLASRNWTLYWNELSRKDMENQRQKLLKIESKLDLELYKKMYSTKVSPLMLRKVLKDILISSGQFPKSRVSVPSVDDLKAYYKKEAGFDQYANIKIKDVVYRVLVKVSKESLKVIKAEIYNW